MKAPDSILWAIHNVDMGDDYLNCSYLQFFCEEKQREEAAKCFQDTFDSTRKKAFDIYREKEGQFEEDDKSNWPGWCSVSLTDDGFITVFGVMREIEGFGWERIGLGLLVGDPVSNAITSVTERFPSISYQGVEHFIDQNNWGGEVWYKEYSRGAEVALVNEILGKELSSALEIFGGEVFWDELRNRLFEEKDFVDVLEFFQIYAAYIQEDTVEKLLKLAEEKDPAIRETLEGEAF